MGYGAVEIERARQRQERIQREAGSARLLAEGEVDYRVDPVLFHNARIRNQKDYGVDNCWNEREFVNDMKRRHPEIAVRNQSRTLRFRVGGEGISCGGHAGRLTRFGRVTFHKRYGT